MEIMLEIFGGMIFASIIIAIFNKIVFAIKWHVFGWRPKIFDEKIVTATVEECAAEAMRNDFLDAEDQGIELTESQKMAHEDRLYICMRQVIERYVTNFSMK